MTICAKCKHHDFRGTIWYDLYCRCPKVKPHHAIDPVTGKLRDEHPPFCREINTDGACEFYEE